MIQGHGNINSPVMIIADGGAPECIASNYALTGYSEILLSQIAGRNLSIKDTYRTLLVKEKINAGEYEDYKSLIPQYGPILVEEINTINPNLIIPMGEGIFSFLTQLESIRKYRGSVLLSNPGCGLRRQFKVLPILGPNPYLNKEFKLRWVSQIDFGKVPKYYGDESVPPDLTTNCWIAYTSSSLRNFLERAYSDDGLLVFDIETFMGVPTCISFCFDGRESVTVPFGDFTIDRDQRILMIQLVARILASKIRKVNQNITYDWRIMARFGFVVNNVMGDTSLAASCLTPELEKNLGFLISIYTELPYHKDEGKQWDVNGMKDKKKFYLYCAKDSLGTWLVNEAQQKEIDEIGSRFVYDSMVSLIPIYKSMEDTGICIDEQQRQFLLAKYTSKYNIEVLKIQKLTNSYANPQSPVQMGKLIFEELGFVKGRYVKDTGEDSLKWLIAFGNSKRAPISGKQILQIIMNCRKLHKVIEALEVVPYPDGKWRATYNLGGAETGRSTSGSNKTEQMILRGEKKIELHKMGHSFQNIGKHGFKIDGEEYGKDLRSMYVPPPGYVFVEVDLSQAEARVDAVLAGNYSILDVFDGPIGIHRLTGSWVYECDPLTIKKNTEEYLISKTARHAAERNIQGEGLVMMIQKDLKFCNGVLQRVHEKQPEIRDTFHRDIKNCIDATRVLKSPNGRSRQFLGRIDQHLYNEAISQLPQAIVSDQTKFSLIPTLKECPWAQLLNEAHDGTLAQMPIGREMEYARVYQRNVETEIDFSTCSLERKYKLVIPSEVSMSTENWLSLKDVHMD